MIEIIEGRGVGAGKSYYVVTRIIKHLVAGGTVFYSDTLQLIPEKILDLCRRRYGVVLESGQMNSVSREDVVRIHEVTPPGTDEMPVLIILDEVQRALNARDWSDKSKRALFDWACESRHDSNDLIFISQNALNIDKQVARLCTYVTRVRNMTGFKLGGISWPFKQFLIHVFDGDGKTSMEKKLISHDNEIFACYRSKSMGGTHKRLFGEPIPKRQLQKVKRRIPMKFLIVMFVLILVVGGGLAYKVFTGPGIPGLASVPSPAAAARPAPSSSPSSSPAATSTVKAHWETVRETMRYITDLEVKTLEGGVYRLQAMSGHGFVEQIQGRVVKVRTATGGVLYVVADDCVGTKKL